MDGTRWSRTAFRLLRSRALLLGVAGVSVLVTVPLVAQAASRLRVTTEGRQAVARSARPLPSSICATVSAASVSTIVGFAVPAPTTATRNLAATPANYGISAVVTTCTFGAQATVADLTKDVSLVFEVTSKPITTREIKQSLAKTASASLKIAVTSYSGLGVPAVYEITTGGGIRGEGITALVGTKVFSANVFSTLSMSKLASLVKLAEKL
jgi:hypothetical protein